MRPEFRIEAGAVGKNSRVWIDGWEISHMLRGVSVDTHVGRITTVNLEVLPARVEVVVKELSCLNVLINVDTSELDKALSKTKELVELQKELNRKPWQRTRRALRRFLAWYLEKRNEIASS